jgi:hypothetical protein
MLNLMMHRVTRRLNKLRIKRNATVIISFVGHDDYYYYYVVAAVPEKKLRRILTL